MIVIADDITGAAEMAGIAHQHGLSVRLSIAGSLCCDRGAAERTDVLVIATDTRSMTEEEAVNETLRITSQLSTLNSHLSPLTSHLFKKTDSALRGHVVAELSALMQATSYQRAVYLPANPSKGRVIRNGCYYIKEVRGEKSEVREVPIHETAFSYDPEFPAKTSVLKERFPDAETHHILMPDAETTADIQYIVTANDDNHTLFAGAADLFETYIEVRGERLEAKDLSESKNYPLTSHLSPLTSKSTLFLCGSTQSKPLDLGIPVTAMPMDIYDGSKDITSWLEEACAIYQREGSLMITIPHRHRTGKDVAVHLRETTARLIQHLVERQQPRQLIIEGGASTFATLRHLGWNELKVVSQLAPGVIKTKAPNGTFVIMKPGSYPWGSLFSC